MQKAVLISRGTCWRKGLAFALCSPLSFTIIMGPSFREGRICRYVSWSYSEREIGMLFDSEMYIGFAGIVLSVDDVNQYWSLVRPVLVDDSYQYWSEVWPVLLASLTSTGSFCDFWKSLYVRISDTLYNNRSGYHQPGPWAEVSGFLGAASLRCGTWWRNAPYTLYYICRRWLCCLV